MITGSCSIGDGLGDAAVYSAEGDGRVVCGLLAGNVIEGIVFSDHRDADVCDFLYGLKVLVRGDYFISAVCNGDPGYENV